MELSLAVEDIPKSSWRGLWLFRCCNSLIGGHQYYINSKATTEDKHTDFRRCTINSSYSD
jgi:hypothetical protein